MKTKKTVTQKVLLANRANARKSTGPRNTAAVTQNARKHGLLSKNLQFKNDEDAEAFRELLEELDDEQKPAGPMERTLLEDAAISIWKLRATTGWDIAELTNRRKAAKAVLRTVGENWDDEQLQLFTDVDEKASAARRGWDCHELIIRTGMRNAEEEESIVNGANSKAGHVQIEAKLTSSLESILRYQGATRRDLYRAVAVLRDIRDNRAGGEQS
jgi:hypothetical protein